MWCLSLGNGDRRVADSVNLSGKALFPNGLPFHEENQKNNVKCAMLNDKLVIY